ncbi:hypothetical protein OSTOST_20419 [Ostertagia ostertagi]
MHWFLTLFSTCLPRDCVMRVWDALMLQGSEVLLRTAIALWSKMSRTILRTSSADEFYTLMGKLCKELAEMDPGRTGSSHNVYVLISATKAFWMSVGCTQ